MVASKHTGIAALSREELLADGVCKGAEAASEFSGLSLNKLYDLMNAEVLPWRWEEKARLIPRRALVEILKDIFDAPQPMARPRPGAKKTA